MGLPVLGGQQFHESAMMRADIEIAEGDLVGGKNSQ
jgi:hypothetical protein